MNLKKNYAHRKWSWPIVLSEYDMKSFLTANKNLVLIILDRKFPHRNVHLFELKWFHCFIHVPLGVQLKSIYNAIRYL